MAAPYQPGYSQLNSGRFGFRYKPEPFVDNITPAYGMDGDKNVSPPPNMNVNPNVQSQTMQYQNPGDNEQQQQAAQDQNRLEVAGSYGYEPGKANPLGLLPGGSFLNNFLYGEDAKFNFGEAGTTDAAGNIFQTSPTSGLDRSYDPITGAPVGYASPSDWYGSWTGLGTEEGLGGPNSSYGQLRAAGENPIASALGSYENSSYYIPWEDRNYGITPANLAGINDTGARLRYNTSYLNPDLITNYDMEGALNPEENDEYDLYNISKGQLGFDGSRMESSGLRAYDPTNAQFMDRSLIGTQGAIPGQVVYLKDSGQYGVVNESGTISTPSGTVIQTGGTWNPDYEDHDGNRGRWENQISLLNSRDPEKAALDEQWKADLAPGGWTDEPGYETPTTDISGYTVDTTPGGWTDEPGYDTFNPGIDSEYTNSGYTVDTEPGGWTDEPDYDTTNWNDTVGQNYDAPTNTESSSNLSSSVNEGAEGNVVEGGEHDHSSPSSEGLGQADDDWGSWFNTGGQIPNRAGGK